jgi:hypothetical protein
MAGNAMIMVEKDCPLDHTSEAVLRTIRMDSVKLSHSRGMFTEKRSIVRNKKDSTTQAMLLSLEKNE